jgi:hypothetical protein
MPGAFVLYGQEDLQEYELVAWYQPFGRDRLRGWVRVVANRWVWWR